jgi:hypothetical protein
MTLVTIMISRSTIIFAFILLLLKYNIYDKFLYKKAASPAPDGLRNGLALDLWKPSGS